MSESDDRRHTPPAAGILDGDEHDLEAVRSVGEAGATESSGSGELEGK